MLPRSPVHGEDLDRDYSQLKDDFHSLLQVAYDLLIFLQKAKSGQAIEDRLYRETISRMTMITDTERRRTKKNGVRRHRSHSERKGYERRVIHPVDPKTESPVESDRSSPIYCFVSELNFTKIVNQLINNPAARKSAFLLQALRQQITITSSKEYAVQAITVYAEKDVLSLKNRRHSVVATILVGTENGLESKEQLARFINALASFKTGRNYLLAVGGGKELLCQVVTALRTRRIHGHAHDHAIATLQKLSIRGSVCRELLGVGFLDWLLLSLELRQSCYGAEFGCALLLNLTLCPSASSVVSRHADQLLASLAALLKMKNTGLCLYLNGALYAAFSYGRVRARAREIRFDVQLQNKLDRSDCNLDHLHIPFLLKQMRGEAEMVRVPPLTQNDDDDVASDHCEDELDSTDQLKPVGAELAGARLLLAKVLATPQAAIIEDVNIPPGFVPRSFEKRTKKRTVSRSEPRITSATSHATFTVEHDARKPLTQPLALSELAIALRASMENEKEKTKEKENSPERDSGRNRRKTRRMHAHSMEEPPKEPKPVREPSPTKNKVSKTNSNDSDASAKKRNKEVKQRSPVSDPKEPRSSRKPLRVMDDGARGDRPERAPDPPDEPVKPFTLTELATPVTGSFPQRIPDDANAHEYISVFGSRPKVARTPDRDNRKPISALLY